MEVEYDLSHSLTHPLSGYSTRCQTHICCINLAISHLCSLCITALKNFTRNFKNQICPTNWSHILKLAKAPGLLLSKMSEVNGIDPTSPLEDSMRSPILIESTRTMNCTWPCIKCSDSPYNHFCPSPWICTPALES